jgi:hypothetical protein
MSSSITPLAGIETFVGGSTAPADIGQQTEQREIVRTKGEQGNGVDGPVGHS